jgi:hypothetical protein
MRVLPRKSVTQFTDYSCNRYQLSAIALTPTSDCNGIHPMADETDLAMYTATINPDIPCNVRRSSDSWTVIRFNATNQYSV